MLYFRTDCCTSMGIFPDWAYVTLNVFIFINLNLLGQLGKVLMIPIPILKLSSPLETNQINFQTICVSSALLPNPVGEQRSLRRLQLQSSPRMFAQLGSNVCILTFLLFVSSYYTAGETQPRRTIRKILYNEYQCVFQKG